MRPSTGPRHDAEVRSERQIGLQSCLATYSLPSTRGLRRSLAQSDAAGHCFEVAAHPTELPTAPMPLTNAMRATELNEAWRLPVATTMVVWQICCSSTASPEMPWSRGDTGTTRRRRRSGRRPSQGPPRSATLWRHRDGDLQDPRVKFIPFRFHLLHQAVSCPLGPCMRGCRRAEGSSP